MSTEFAEAVSLLDGIGETARSLLEAVTEENVTESIKAKAKFLIATRLMREAREAMSDHPEYNYGPLQEHLLRNLENVDHVVIDDTLDSAEIFDPTIGGTASDFESGLYKSGRDARTRSLGWRWGVYLPAFGGSAGFQWTKKSKPRIIADYHAVIQDRLAQWGEKAPYWYFLEHGNSQVGGKGSPYPTFGATDFIAKTAQAAPGILDMVIREEEMDIEAGAEQLLEEAEFVGKRKQVRVESREIGIGYRKETFVSAHGSIYVKYRAPSGRWASYETMMASAE